jgi:flagellar protein FliS
MTNDDPANAYLRSQVMSASPEQLRLMLIDGAIKFARQGRQGLLDKDYERSFNGLSQCRDIVTELMTTMRTEVDPELCERVRALYTFMFTELVEASMSKDAERVVKVIELLEFERETWVMLMDKLASERSQLEETRSVQDPEQPRAPLSVQG